jgi:hypothetical protein
VDEGHIVPAGAKSDTRHQQNPVATLKSALAEAPGADMFEEPVDVGPFDRRQREPLLRLLLLHRYSHLKAQIAVPGWQAAPDFPALAALILNPAVAHP